MTDYDSPWKEALDLYFQPFMHFCFPALAEHIDWSVDPKMLDKELMQIAPQSELGARTVDKLVEVKLFSGDVGWLLVHLEVQSQRDSEFTRRMFVYFYRIRDKYNKRVVSLAVLGDGEANWRPDRYQESHFGCQFDFTFPVVKLLDFAKDISALENSTNPFAFVILAHLMTMQTADDPQDRCRWKMRRMDLNVEQLSPIVLFLAMVALSWGENNWGQLFYIAEDVRKLFRVLDWMMKLPEDIELEFQQQLEQYEQEHSVPYITSIERMATQKGALIGEIRLLQRILSIAMESEESLTKLPKEELTRKRDELQVRFDSRQYEPKRD